MIDSTSARNLALNKPATQSSVSVWSRSALREEDARGGNNGDVSGELGFHTEEEQDPWWQVDLLQPHKIKKVLIFNRRHMAERLCQFTLLFSVDGKVWLEVYKKRDSLIFGQNFLAPYSVFFPQGGLARYIKIRLDGWGVLHLNELEVYGEEYVRPVKLDPIVGAEAHRELQAPIGVYSGYLANLTVIQTSDPFHYAEMLFTTSRTVRTYCRSNRLDYEAYIGIKRGFYPYQATFNRIYMLRELVERGHAGWVLYMDADAFIADLSFDIRAFLLPQLDKAFLATPSGASDLAWDVNAGVFFINLSHPTGLAILEKWFAAYEAADDNRLRECSQWYTGLDDQQMLHEILKELPEYFSECAHLPWELVNSPTATFIRQHLRAMHDDMATRVGVIDREVQEIMRAGSLFSR